MCRLCGNVRRYRLTKTSSFTQCRHLTPHSPGRLVQLSVECGLYEWYVSNGKVVLLFPRLNVSISLQTRLQDRGWQ
jgi:hypothetical protein